MTAAVDVHALTEQLIGAWVRWDLEPGNRARARELVAAEKAFEPLGLEYPQLTARVTHHRRGQPDLPGRHGHQAAVADAVQAAVNDLVPPLRVIECTNQPYERLEQREAS